MKVQPGMVLTLAEPSSYGWHDPDPWTFLVLELVVEGGQQKARLLCVGTLNERRLGKVTTELVEQIELDIELPAEAEGTLWRLL